VCFNPGMAHARLEEIAQKNHIDPRDAELQLAAAVDGYNQPTRAIPGYRAALVPDSSRPGSDHESGQIKLKVALLAPAGQRTFPTGGHFQALGERPSRSRCPRLKPTPSADETLVWSIPPEKQLAAYLKWRNPLSRKHHHQFWMARCWIIIWQSGKRIPGRGAGVF